MTAIHWAEAELVGRPIVLENAGLRRIRGSNNRVVLKVIAKLAFGNENFFKNYLPRIRTPTAFLDRTGGRGLSHRLGKCRSGG